MKAICSKKCAVPFVRSVSAREPASIHAPTVAVCAAGFDSVATVKPLDKVVVWVIGPRFTTEAKVRRGTRTDPVRIGCRNVLATRPRANIAAKKSVTRREGNEVEVNDEGYEGNENDWRIVAEQEVASWLP